MAKLELSVATVPPIKAYPLTHDDGFGEIPPNLADVTHIIIEIYKANGDLDWLSDMVSDAESDEKIAAAELIA